MAGLASHVDRNSILDRLDRQHLERLGVALLRVRGALRVDPRVRGLRHLGATCYPWVGPAAGGPDSRTHGTAGADPRWGFGTGKCLRGDGTHRRSDIRGHGDATGPIG